MKKETILKLAGGAVVGVAAVGAYKKFVKPWQLQWGATAEEVAQAMPGDEIVEAPVLTATRAITINAKPGDVWPWLMQMGYGRAGFYSYDLVDNSRRLSAERIIPELQFLKVGDAIPTSPNQGLIVEKIEPERLLVMTIRGEKTTLSVTAMLNEVEEGKTRLIVRLRLNYSWGVRRSLYFQIFEPGDFVMMRKMMLGIKRRAEAIHEIS
ncbi:MAG: hypothetical protein JNM09_10005 [Blastocatellia bacterium]|nr:hypothetical protein [Blastocatellia bacterium]